MFRGPRLRRILLVAAAALVLYAIVGFFVVPPLARAQLEKRLGAALARPVSVAKVRFNPFALSVAVYGFRALDHDGAELASCELAKVNFDPLVSLLRREWHFGEVHLVAPRQRLLIDDAGRLNVADLAAAPAATPPPAEAPRPPEKFLALGVGRLRVERWALDFTDQSRRTPFHTRVGPMTFSVTGFTTRPEADSPYVFAGQTDSGERFAWSGTIAVQPLGSRGRIEFGDLTVPKYLPFLEAVFAGEIRSGRLALACNYDVVLAGETRAQLADATISLADLQIARPGVVSPALELRTLEVSARAADLVQRTAEITRVAIDGLEVHASRLADGTIDLLGLLPAAQKSGAAEPAGASTDADGGAAPSIRIAEITVTDSRVSWLDLATPRAANVTLDQIALTARNVGTDLDRDIALDGHLRWAGRGAFALSGKVRPLPFAAALDLEAGALDLAPLAPYVHSFAAVNLGGGDLHFAGHVEAARAPGEKLAATWTGEAGLDQLVVTTADSQQPLLGWKSLALTKTKFSLEPLEISIGGIALTGPVVDLVVDKEGRFNFSAAFASPEAAASAAAENTAAPAAEPTSPAAAPASPAAPVPARTSERVAAATHQSLPFRAALDTLTLSGARIRFSDQTFEPGFAAELRDFSGTIRGLSSANLARADVDLHGTLDGVAPLRIAGQINPLAEDRFSDVTVEFSGIALPAFTPYAARYLGQTVKQGSLRIDLAYRVSQNVLEGENRAVFDQFYLGEKVESPDAIHLPVGLAIALLRERDGRIPLNLPVRGNLDDPNFRFGGLIWQALRNILMKAATAPFSLLGGLLGGGGHGAANASGGVGASGAAGVSDAAAADDLSFVDFTPGTAGLNAIAEQKLDALREALFQKPAVQLEIHALPAPVHDRPALLELRLAALLQDEKNLEADATVASDNTTSAAPVSGGAAPAQTDETEALVQRAFARRFPEEAAASGIALAAGPAPAARSPRPGAMGRFFNWMLRKPEPVTDPSRGEGDAAGAPTTGVSPGATAATQPALATADMRARLLATIALTDADFATLTAERARAIRERLLADGRVEPARVAIAAAPHRPDGASTAVENVRVYFALR